VKTGQYLITCHLKNILTAKSYVSFFIYRTMILPPFAITSAFAYLALVGGIAHAGDAAFPVGGAAPGDGGVLGILRLASAKKGGEGEGEEREDDFFHVHVLVAAEVGC